MLLSVVVHAVCVEYLLATTVPFALQKAVPRRMQYRTIALGGEPKQNSTSLYTQGTFKASMCPVQTCKYMHES
jgi:hypothetical protein